MFVVTACSRESLQPGRMAHGENFGSWKLLIEVVLYYTHYIYCSMIYIHLDVYSVLLRYCSARIPPKAIADFSAEQGLFVIITWRHHDLAEDNACQNGGISRDMGKHYFRILRLCVHPSLHLCLQCVTCQSYSVNKCWGQALLFRLISTNTCLSHWSIHLPHLPIIHSSCICRVEHGAISVTYSLSRETSAQSLPGNFSLPLSTTQAH